MCALFLKKAFFRTTTGIHLNVGVTFLFWCDKILFNTFSFQNMSDKKLNASPLTNFLTPPPDVQGMKTLDRYAFRKTVEVPSVLVHVVKLKEAIKVLKPCFLKVPNLHPVQGEGKEKKILLHPHLFDETLPYLQKHISKLSLGDVLWTKINLSYENFSPEAIFKAVLPTDTAGNVSSYSIIGHVIHLNLKDNLMDYKYLIGQVLLDKFTNIKTVVNKAQMIDNEFRNFNMELLAGEPNYEVLVKEHNCQYAFDFSKVFWNPRLVNEHNEIVKKAHPGDLVYDMFAGVGPFAVPLAKKKCIVHANDLNPDSYHWLCHNATLNKVNEYLHTYNMDGKDFILSVIKNGLIEHWNKSEDDCQVHIIMNLPACALEFLKVFKGLLVGQNIEKIGTMPIIYCYFFLKKDEEIIDVCKKYFDEEVHKNSEITTVRLVAPNKMMMRIAYKIPKSVLFLEESFSEPYAKRIRLDEPEIEQRIEKKIFPV